MATDEVLTAAELERRIVQFMRDRLPETWKVTDAAELQQHSLRPDLSIQLETSDGKAARLLFMAGAAEELVGDPTAVSESVALLAQDLLEALDSQGS